MERRLLGTTLFCLCAAVLACGTLAFAQDLEPVKGHTIKVDKDVSDWVGTAPVDENTAAVSQGEFIWKDAKDDDTGAGEYTYPTNAAFKRCADLREFRVTCDYNNLYLLIRFNKPGDYWAPYCVIGIDQDGAEGGSEGTAVLTEGNVDYVNADEGNYGELKVAPELACDYVVSVFSCYRGRIWNAKGELVARRDGKKEDTPGFAVDDNDWSALEVAIPLSVIGTPAGKTWRFIVATGLEEYGHLREMSAAQSEWKGGGGLNGEKEGKVDPDVFDLASPNASVQVLELGSYVKNGRPGDANAFAVINKSFVTVKFAGAE